MTIRWLSDDYPMTIWWLSDDYPMTIQWLSPTCVQFFLMIIDLKRSLDQRWLFKSGAIFILMKWSCSCGLSYCSKQKPQKDNFIDRLNRNYLSFIVIFASLNLYQRLTIPPKTRWGVLWAFLWPPTKVGVRKESPQQWFWLVQCPNHHAPS